MLRNRRFSKLTSNFEASGYLKAEVFHKVYSRSSFLKKRANDSTFSCSGCLDLARPENGTEHSRRGFKDSFIRRFKHVISIMLLVFNFI